MSGPFLNQPLRARALMQPWRNCIDLHLYQQMPDGSVNVVTRFEITRHEPGVIPPDASISLSIPEAQSLMDQLWDCGLRPTEGTGSAGALAATQKHLDDMRALAFARMEVPKP